MLFYTLGAGVEQCHVVLLLSDTSVVANGSTDVGFEGRGLTYSNGPSVDQNQDDIDIAFAVCCLLPRCCRGVMAGGLVVCVAMISSDIV